MSYYSRRGVMIALLVGLVASSASAASAQTPLSQVEIRFDRVPAGNCLHCDPHSLGAYRIKISGDGTVEYHNADEPEDVVHVRIISVDDVIALANEFIAAEFLDAREFYSGKIELVRKGDGVRLQGSGGGSEAPAVHLTLRIGERVKRVTLVDGYPQVLGRLPDLVDRIGGPAYWSGGKP